MTHIKHTRRPGRPALPPADRLSDPIAVRLSRDDLMYLDYYCSVHGVPRGTALRSMVIAHKIDYLRGAVRKGGQS